MNDATIHTLAGARVEPIEIRQAVARFTERLRLRGFASNTLRTYRATLEGLAEFLAARDVTLLALISERMVDGWLDHLARSGNSLRSQANKLATLRSLVSFAMREGWIRHDPTTQITIKFRPGRVIAPELDRLLAVIEAIPQRTATDLRDRAMLRLGLDAALRVSEVAALEVTGACCVDFRRLQVHVPNKGGGIGTVGINERTRDALQAWQAVRHTVALPDVGALFVSRLGRGFTRAQLHNIVQRRGAAAGIEGLHWHLLRHRRIGDVVEHLGLDAGQHVARHANKSTTANVYGAHAAEVLRSLVRDKCDLDRMAVAS